MSLMRALKWLGFLCLSLASITSLAADKELMAAYERGMRCYRNLACRPTIAPTTVKLLETMKCTLDPKCKEKLDLNMLAQLGRLKEEFPDNESASAYYQRAYGPDRDPAYASPSTASEESRSAGSKGTEKKAPVYEEISIDQKTTLDSQFSDPSRGQ